MGLPLANKRYGREAAAGGHNAELDTQNRSARTCRFRHLDGHKRYRARPERGAGGAAVDRLVAPIALYPDPLLAQILMASTYPLKVVEAARWISAPANRGLSGDALTNAISS